MDTLPAQFEDWKLMEPGGLPGFYEEIGKIEFEGHAWRLGLGAMGTSLYLFTDLPHPDDGSRKANYAMNYTVPIRRLADHLTEVMA